MIYQYQSDYLYSVIENQLLASGFIVRDRQLFNQSYGTCKFGDFGCAKEDNWKKDQEEKKVQLRIKNIR